MLGGPLIAIQRNAAECTASTVTAAIYDQLLAVFVGKFADGFKVRFAAVVVAMSFVAGK